MTFDFQLTNKFTHTFCMFKDENLWYKLWFNQFTINQVKKYFFWWFALIELNLVHHFYIFVITVHWVVKAVWTGPYLDHMELRIQYFISWDIVYLILLQIIEYCNTSKFPTLLQNQENMLTCKQGSQNKSP